MWITNTHAFDLARTSIPNWKLNEWKIVLEPADTKIHHTAEKYIKQMANSNDSRSQFAKSKREREKKRTQTNKHFQLNRNIETEETVVKRERMKKNSVNKCSAVNFVSRVNRPFFGKNEWNEKKKIGFLPVKLNSWRARGKIFWFLLYKEIAWCDRTEIFSCWCNFLATKCANFAFTCKYNSVSSDEHHSHSLVG